MPALEGDVIGMLYLVVFDYVVHAAVGAGLIALFVNLVAFSANLVAEDIFQDIILELNLIV